MTGEILINDLIAVMEKSSNEPSTSGGYREVALVWLKHIIKDIGNSQLSWHWRFLEKSATFPTVSGQHTYDQPDDIDTNKMFALYERTNDITYKFVDYNTFVRLVPDPSNHQGDPGRIWTFFGTTIRIFPVPNSVITVFLDYIRVMSNPTDDDTVLDIPDKYEDVVFKGMFEKAVRYDSDLGNLQLAKSEYRDALKRMKDENRMMIGDKRSMSISHKARHSGFHDHEGKNSIFLPLGGPNV